MRPRFAMLLLATAVPASARAATTFSSVLDDVGLRAEVGTGIYGDELTGNLGVQSLGIRDFDRRWLVSWEADAELVIGGVAYEHPFYWLYGAQGAAQGEGGLRLLPAAAWSPYVSASLEGSLSAVAQQGVPLNGGATINDLGDLGGVIGSAGARLGLGASYLWARSSLLLEAEPLAEVDSAEADQALLGYFGAGLRARYDLRDSLVAIGEASYAVTSAQRDTALGSSIAWGRWSLAASAVKKLGRRFFAGLGLSVSRAAAQTSYSGGQSYGTSSPVDSRLWLLFGFWP
ncbi:MAG: hypothetical protein ACYDCL_19080 [Myxococcales bacterium]